MSRPLRGPGAPLSFIVASLLVLAASLPLSGQEAVRIFAGDSIRVDGEIVGRVLSVEGPMMTVVSRQAPRCRAGQMHGDAPICDPAPLERHTVSLSEVVVERRMEKPHLMLRTLAGGVIGGAAFGFAGYHLGPTVGFGRVDGCLFGTSNINCATGEQRYTAEQIAARQKASDQKKGAMFFGVLGGTASAILFRKLSVGWVRVQPVISVDPADEWGMSFSVPTR